VLGGAPPEGGISREQSGHIICLRDHVTGDGLASALLLCGALRAAGRCPETGGDGAHPVEAETCRDRPRPPTGALVERVAAVNAD